MMLRALHLAENLAILSLLTASAVAMQLSLAYQKSGGGNRRPGRANR